MLVIIPARGGSKGLPGKNIKPLNGKPLIAYTIEAALASVYVTDVLVSTDSLEIAEIAKKHGAWVPELRPAELSGDTAKSIDVIIYTLNLLREKFNKNFEEVIVLQPTSPLRRVEHLDESVALYRDKNAESVISYTETDHPIFWCKYIDEDLKFLDVFSDIDLVNRQEYKKTYTPNGAIYIVKTSLLKEKRLFYSEKSYAYVMEKKSSIDIDSEIDFKLAELLELQQRNENI